MQKCPLCNCSFDWNSSTSEHQVNDNFELIFCSYDCSVVYTHNYIINNNITDKFLIDELMENV